MFSPNPAGDLAVVNDEGGGVGSLLCDLNAQDSARIGQLSPGQKAGVVRCQVSSGGKPQDPVAGAIVPPRPLPGEQSSNQAAKVEAAATNPSA